MFVYAYIVLIIYVLQHPSSIQNAHTLKVNEQQRFLVDAFVVVELILKRKNKEKIILIDFG